MSVELASSPPTGGDEVPSARPLPSVPPSSSVPPPFVRPPRPPPSTSSTFTSSADPYEEDRQRSPCLYFFYRWINPWCRMLFIFVILYVYALSSGVLTYRNNTFQDEMQALVNVAPNPYAPTHPLPGDPPDTRPEREDLIYDYPYIGNRTYVPFILRDLFFDFIPALQGKTRAPWQEFADATPIIWNVVMLLMLLIRMDVIRWSEYLAIQMILFSVNALVHVSTTYPDAGGYQSSCVDLDKHENGPWMFHYITTAYCGDMMWSGHTQETLIPLIIIRRLMWDSLGWNLTWGETRKVDRREALERHPWLFSGIHQDHERNALFMQYVQQHHQRQEGKPPLAHPPPDGVEKKEISAAPLETYAPQYSAAKESGVSRPTVAEVEDELALQPHEKFDVHLNVAEATSLRPNQRPNLDHDAFFRIFKSPYQTPAWVERHRALTFIFASTVRLMFLIWFPFLLVALILCRYHYSDDILVAIFVTLLVSTNTHLLQWWVRMIYRPFYHNVLYQSPFRPIYLKWPLNAEQVNFEERIRRVGIGGLI